ncbi:metal-sensitive transcriptional regulator [Desulfitobacterium hafniense]|uniref:CsoR family transcriptional regulator n=2 Tax=Desulfitobacterium hafniense TaxID=49338 RepID=Q24NU2_DESHY|nr:metal-sensitive transcriptional regulator [Desulfitobacterium hafniense]BAE86300.1 hypothetical protein DSY4511 [Desulfitobacterium hafniense Y51]CDX04775.1 Metal-sensitive transcriptional repressor [Desulfitobacterium hafniense]
MVDEIKEKCSTCETESNGTRTAHHDEKTIKELINRLNRIEGQVRGVKGMIERHIYCDDVLNQITSVQSALDGVSKLLLEKHFKSCVKDRLSQGDDEVIDELLKTIFRMKK